MGRKNGAVGANSRSTLYSNRVRIPEFGARHPIEYDTDLDDFFGDIHGALQNSITDGLVNGRKADGTRGGRRFFRVYDDPMRVGVSVLERRVMRTQSQRGRLRWSKADEGRVKQEISNAVASEDLTGFPHTARFTDIVRVGDADSSNARKLGLILDQENEVAETLVREHEIVVNSIRGMLSGFREPYSPYIPHFTVVRIDRELGKQGIDRAIGAIGALLPHTVQLQPLTFYAGEEA